MRAKQAVGDRTSSNPSSESFAGTADLAESLKHKADGEVLGQASITAAPGVLARGLQRDGRRAKGQTRACSRTQCENQPLKCNLHILLFWAKEKKARAAREKFGGYSPSARAAREKFWPCLQNWGLLPLRAQRTKKIGPVSLVGVRSVPIKWALSHTVGQPFLSVFSPFFTPASECGVRLTQLVPYHGEFMRYKVWGEA